MLIDATRSPVHIDTSVSQHYVILRLSWQGGKNAPVTRTDDDRHGRMMSVEPSACISKGRITFTETLLHGHELKNRPAIYEAPTLTKDMIRNTLTLWRIRVTLHSYPRETLVMVSDVEKDVDLVTMVDRIGPMPWDRPPTFPLIEAGARMNEDEVPTLWTKLRNDV